MELAPLRTPTSSRARSFAFGSAFVVLLGLAIAAAILPPLHLPHATARPPEPPARATLTRNHTGHGRTTAPRPPRDPSTRSSTADRLVRSGQPIFCGAGTKPIVALTFDDGPGILTPMALDQLRSHHAVATFFLVGKLVHQPWLSSDLRAETHFPGLAFGDHTWDHVSVKHASTKFLNQEVLRARHAIGRATGQQVSLFRPPLGEHDENLARYLRSHGMLQILWSIDSRDSQGANANKIYRIVRNGLSPGDIILLHDNRGTTEKALPRILDLIDRRGLTTVTVPELLSQDPPSERQLRQHTCP